MSSTDSKMLYTRRCDPFPHSKTFQFMYKQRCFNWFLFYPTDIPHFKSDVVRRDKHLQFTYALIMRQNQFSRWNGYSWSGMRGAIDLHAFWWAWDTPTIFISMSQKLSRNIGPRFHVFPRDPGKDAVRGPQKLSEELERSEEFRG